MCQHNIIVIYKYINLDEFSIYITRITGNNITCFFFKNKYQKN